MNRYYNAEHIKKLIESHEWRMTLAKERGGNGFVEYDKLVLDSKEFQKRLSSLPTIEIGNVNDDLIKRQDVIKIIDKYYKQFVFTSDADEVIVEIESLQTVIPSKASCAEGKWIPVDERLPEDGVRVMCCDDREDIYFGRHEYTGWHWEAEACANYWAKDDSVIAWMPLPEPYKESEG